MFRRCTMAPSLATRFHGQLSQALFNRGLKLLANVPELYYFPKPSDQLLSSTFTGSITVHLPCTYRALTVCPLSLTGTPRIRSRADG
jgi:hypothetical protein